MNSKEGQAPDSFSYHSTDRQAMTIYLVSALTVMAGGLVAPALALLEHDLGQGRAEGTLSIRLVLTLPALFTALSSITLALLSDRIGKRWVLVSSLILYAAAGLFGALATELGFLLITRSLLGIAVGGLMTSSVGLIVDLFDGERQRIVLGRQSAFMGIGSIMFLAIGGALALISWRASFLLYGLALPLIPLAVRWLPPDSHRSSDLQPLQISGGVRVLVSVLSFSAFGGMACYFLTPTMAPFLLIEFGYESPLLVGGVIALASCATAAMSANYSRIRRRIGPNGVFIASFAMMGLGYLIVWFSTSLPVATLGIVLAGAGFGVMLPNLGGWVADAIEEEYQSKVIGLATMALFLGQFLSPILAEPVVRSSGVSASFGVAGIILFAMCVLLAAIARPVEAALQTKSK